MNRDNAITRYGEAVVEKAESMYETDFDKDFWAHLSEDERFEYLERAKNAMRTKAKDLPTPRLQIVWEDEEGEPNSRIATYELVIHEGEKCKADIRANDENDHPSCNPVKVEIGKTRVSGGGGIISENGKLSTPFRDGVHIMRDSAALKLPMFVMYGDMVHPIEQNKEVEKEWA